MKPFRILFFGTWGYGRAGLEALLQCPNVDIVKVFTKWDPEHPDEYMDQVKNLAQENGLETMNTMKSLCPKSAFEAGVLACRNIDFIISCCYDRIFSPAIIQLPKIKALNIHPSLLPKYRGVKPLENAIIGGDKETGITLHELTPVLDAGDIVLQRAGIQIDLEKSYRALYDEQCMAIQETIIVFFHSPEELLATSYPQNESEISWAPRLKFEIKNWMTVKVISLIHLGEWGGDIFINL